MFVHCIDSSYLYRNQLKQIEKLNPSELNCHDFFIAYNLTQTLDRPTHVSTITVWHTILLTLDSYYIFTILSALFKNRSLRTASSISEGILLYYIQNCPQSCKSILENAKSSYAQSVKVGNKRLGSHMLLKITNMITNSSKLVPTIINGPDLISFSLDKAKIFAMDFTSIPRIIPYLTFPFS